MVPFAILFLIIIALAVISCLPDSVTLYTSLPMVIAWGALAVSALCYILRRKLYRRQRLFWLHIAFVIILAGAALTHFFGSTETVHLRKGETTSIGNLNVCLKDFTIDYYPGTAAPCDFISTLIIDGREYNVAMNHVASVDGYRFFQTSYDMDQGGSVLTVSHDPLGNGITYAGYALLFVTLCICLLPKNNKSIKLATFIIGLSTLTASTTNASQTPPALPEDLASQLGTLYVYHKDRIAPLSTLADEFTRHITGSRTYKGLSSEQFMSAWLFYYDSWKNEPCIKIKDSSTKSELGGKSKVSLTDYFDANGYRFTDSRHTEANEKFSVASSASTGMLWRIFPYMDSEGMLVWLSPVDDMPDEMPVEDWHIAKHSLNYLAQLVDESNWEEAKRVVAKIAEFQRKHSGGYLPTPAQTKCERLYTRLASTPIAPISMIVCGLLLLIFPHRRASLVVGLLSALWIASIIVLNWVASGHAPMSNGEETMQWMALCALVVSIILNNRSRPIVPLGLIVASLALFVALMGQRTPQITQLMPVLNSPLLSIHVLTVMLAYSLLALMAMNGILWLCGRRDMVAVARSLVRPAVFMLTAGIFIGAIWANVSWGRYWGWDPKEVWALITMLIYSIALHDHIFTRFRNDKFFAVFSIVAFFSVLMTYFGVNFFLGGLHSYS